MAKPIFDRTHPKIIEKTFSFPKFAPACKKSVHSNTSFNTVNFRVPWLDWLRPFLAMPIQKIFDQLLVYVNLYHHAISLIYSGDMVD